MASRCPVCDSSELVALGERDGYAIAQCVRCGHSFVRNMPSPEELEAVYERYSYDAQPLEAVPAFLTPVIEERVRELEPYRRSGRLIDVGFGAGGFLQIAKAAGWKAYGVEVSKLAVEQAKKHGLEDVVLGDFVSAPFDEGFFDVIVMSELIEHLTDPRAFVRRARELLAPGGLLLMTTPHGRGVSGRLLKASWSVCAPPEHLHLFSRRSIERLLVDAGFDQVRAEARNVHPHEILSWAKARLTGAREEAAFSADERVQGSYRVNAALVGTRWGRLVKRAANRVLDLTSLGDGLVVRATVNGAVP